MITIEEGLLYHLQNTAGVAALVSTRVYPNKLPETVTFPAITYQRIDSPRVLTHDTSGATGTARPRFQFDAWGTTYASAKAVTDAIRAALNGYVGAMGTGGSTVTVQSSLIQDERFDDFGDAGILRISSDYIIWHLE